MPNIGCQQTTTKNVICLRYARMSIMDKEIRVSITPGTVIATLFIIVGAYVFWLLRDRDSGKQERIKITELVNFINKAIK